MYSQVIFTNWMYFSNHHPDQEADRQEAPSCPLLVITYPPPSRVTTVLTSEACISFACFYTFYTSGII